MKIPGQLVLAFHPVPRKGLHQKCLIFPGVGNAENRDKLEVYGESTYGLTRQIPRMAPEEWTPELLNERQIRLAARAVHRWRSDFA